MKLLITKVFFALVAATLQSVPYAAEQYTTVAIQAGTAVDGGRGGAMEQARGTIEPAQQSGARGDRLNTKRDNYYGCAWVSKADVPHYEGCTWIPQQ